MEKHLKSRKIVAGSLGIAAVVLLTLAACSREAAPATLAASAPAGPPPLAPMAVVPDDSAPFPETMADTYVYYPQYEVYYNSYRRQYAYRDGGRWIWRSEPPHVSVNVLYASPSVRMDFHDAPAKHHATVVRTYPRAWAKPAKEQERH